MQLMRESIQGAWLFWKTFELKIEADFCSPFSNNTHAACPTFETPCLPLEDSWYICGRSHLVLGGHQLEQWAQRFSQRSTAMAVVMLQDFFKNILLQISLFEYTLLHSSFISCLNILCTSIFPLIQLSRSTKQFVDLNYLVCLFVYLTLLLW